MKNKLLASFCAILFLASAVKVQSQSIAYKGIYIDSFDGIVGNTVKEDSLLHYLQDSSFNSIICYRMSSVISSTLSSSKNTTLANFLKKARTQYGIKNVLASSESYDTFNSLVAPYNRSRTDSAERFNYYYLEFEFWNVHSTSPVSSANNGYYCTTYLSPKGYNCDTSGAFKYYKKMLKSLDSLANKDGIRSATYVGNPNQGQCKFIASTVDLLLCDNYTSNISNIYGNVKTRFSYFGSTSKTLQIVPIFASYSPGGTFLGDWLTKAPVGPHSEQSVYTNYFLPRYNSETGAWKSKLNLIGYQWYRYSGMPHNGNYSTTTFCNPPSNLTTTLITSTTANLNWTGISSGLGYVLQYRVVGSSSWSSPIAVSSTSLAVSSLLPTTNYEFQVKSSCISSTSSFTASALWSTLAASCGDAIGLNATALSDVSATLNWTNVSGASSYSIKYRKVGASSWISTTSLVSTKAVSALSASSIYEFQVQTLCTNGSGAYSASSLFSTLPPVCNAPVGLLANAITSNSATLTWTSISGVSGYNIQYRIIGTSTWISTNSTTNSKNIIALSQNSSYEFQVQTKCSATNASQFSISGIFTTLAGCGIPINIVATAATTNSFTLSWSFNTAATSYTVQYRKTTTTSWTTVSTSSNYKNISSLSTASAYEFQVAMVCASGTSGYSAIGTISTLSNSGTCGIPSGLFVTNIASSSVTLNWIAQSGANSYQVQYRKIGTTSWSSKTTNFTNKNITSLAANTSYEFQVQTICASVSSAFSSSTLFITAGVTARLATDTTNLVLINNSNSYGLEESLKTILHPAELRIFPNPTDMENINLRIQLYKKETIKIQVFDMLGNSVYSELVITNEEGFAEQKIRIASELKSGIYQLIGFTSEQKLSCRLVLKN